MTETVATCPETVSPCGGAVSPSWMRRFRRSGIPIFLVRLTLGGIFIFMGAMKIADPIAFLKQVRLYEMLPETPAYYLNGVAIALPWLEVVCGVALVVGIWIRGAALSIAVMLGVFTPAILIRAMAIHHTQGTPFLEIAFDCGCGSGVVIIWRKLVTNLVLLLMAIGALVSRYHRFNLMGTHPPCKGFGTEPHASACADIRTS